MKYLEAIKAAGLTELQERYVTLCIIQQTPIRTVARAYDTTPATVRAHIDAGLKKLKPYIREDAA